MHHYTHLSAAERNKIAKIHVRHYSPSSIAKALRQKTAPAQAASLKGTAHRRGYGVCAAPKEGKCAPRCLQGAQEAGCTGKAASSWMSIGHQSRWWTGSWRRELCGHLPYDSGTLDFPCTQPNERARCYLHRKAKRPQKRGVRLGLPEALRKAKGGLLSTSVWVSGQTDTVMGPTSACL
jgi:hypothetical protein